ncbi:hypothetical protein V1260_15405 [Brachybacterium sp. J144]|uniref:hypothetical protein n=1 Tax=Brachybacterium sp. J144 TaxID=3116487 RepID=UPI002E75D62D|nr:hypothetical protein [Brachybacterium sp. J144]MEE1652168.1 hypothetical protein [Brachybacterium sp. J144]
MSSMIMQSQWTRRAVIALAIVAAAVLFMWSGTAFANPVAGVDFDPAPEPIPGMSGLTTFINYVAWGVAIVCGVAFLAVIGWLALSVFTGQEVRAGKGLVVVIVAMVLLGAAGVIVGAFI